MNTNEKISIEKVKSALSVISMGILTIQHLVGTFAPDVKVAYIPLTVTYFTIFIGSLGEENNKFLEIASMCVFLIVAIVGVTVYYIKDYNIAIKCVNLNKYMSFFIGISSLILAILYIRRLITVE